MSARSEALAAAETHGWHLSDSSHHTYLYLVRGEDRVIVSLNPAGSVKAAQWLRFNGRGGIQTDPPLARADEGQRGKLHAVLSWLASERVS